MNLSDVVLIINTIINIIKIIVDLAKSTKPTSNI